MPFLHVNYSCLLVKQPEYLQDSTYAKGTFDSEPIFLWVPSDG